MQAPAHIVSSDGDSNTMMWSRPVLDSGAVCHIQRHAWRFSNIGQPYIKAIRCANGSLAPVTGQGSVGRLHNVLHVPTASADIVSVGQYLDQYGGSVVFEHDAVLHVSPCGSRRTLLARRNEDGLFRVTPDTTASVGSAVPVIPGESITHQLAREKVHLLHRCLCHASKQKMKTMLRSGDITVRGVLPKHVDLITTCDACEMGNSMRLPHDKSSGRRSTTYAYRICADSSGRLRTQTKGGRRYVIAAIDQATNFAWIYLARSLSESHVFFDSLINTKLRNDSSPAGTLVHVLRTDNGTEMINPKVDAILEAARVTRERTNRYDSPQNGLAERFIGILFSMIRKVLYESRLPPSFWGEAARACLYAYNMLPCASNPSSRSPYEMATGDKPPLSVLRPFGCTAYANIPFPIQKTKIGARAIKGVMVGYGEVDGKKGYRIYDPAAKRIITSADVRFTDTMAKSVGQRSSEFPHLVLCPDDLVPGLDAITADYAPRRSPSSCASWSSSSLPPSADLTFTSTNIQDDDFTDPSSDSQPPPATPSCRPFVHPSGSDGDDDDDEVVAPPKPPPGKGYYYQSVSDSPDSASGRNTSSSVDDRGPAFRTRSACAASHPDRSSLIAPTMSLSANAPFTNPSRILACYATIINDMNKEFTPATFAEAVQYPKWVASMREEIEQIRKTFRLAHRMASRSSSEN